MTPTQIGEAVRAFRAENCPACGAKNIGKNDTFCIDCFVRLPFELQEAVSDKSTFIEAYHAAMAYLRANPTQPENE